MPLLATLLSLPLTADYAPMAMEPAQQKQQTLHALLTILLRIAAQQPVLFVMEDLHWVDPTTLEFLTLLVDQGPTARILALWTFRPDFSPPWTGRSHLTQVTLPRLPRQQATEMTNRVAHGKALPAEVVAQVVAKTDGVPLFVEELTKMVLESGLLQEREDRYELTGPLPPLAIPTTLHDSLMARLDRLATVKSLAQLGATLGREFSYELLQAVSPWDEGTLQRGLHQLVEAELLYQRGLPPQATYLFKHALIQDAAYQSLLRSTRQQYHQRIAQVLEARFPDLCETQPELLAHHYTEAGFMAQAIPYWQRAGQRAVERSANLEAIGHLTKGLEVLVTLPETRERTQQELALLTTLGPAMIVIKGYGAPEVEDTYLRARELCQQVDDPAQRFPVVRGLWNRYLMRAEHQQARELGEQLLSLAHSLHDPQASSKPIGSSGRSCGTAASCRSPTRIWSRASRCTSRTSIGPWRFAMGQTLASCAGSMPRWSCGHGAIRSRPARGWRRPSRWRRNSPTPTAWRSSWSLRPSSTASAGRCRPPTRGPTRPRSWLRSKALRNGSLVGQSCGAGRSQPRGRRQRASRRSTRAWPPGGRRRPRSYAPVM